MWSEYNRQCQHYDSVSSHNLEAARDLISKLHDIFGVSSKSLISMFIIYTSTFSRGQLFHEEFLSYFLF